MFKRGPAGALALSLLALGFASAAHAEFVQNAEDTRVPEHCYPQAYALAHEHLLFAEPVHGTEPVALLSEGEHVFICVQPLDEEMPVEDDPSPDELGFLLLLLPGLDEDRDCLAREAADPCARGWVVDTVAARPLSG